jgi:plastocyanin
VNSGVAPLGKDVARFSMAFASPGRYSYSCVVHPNMVGTVTVVSPGAQQSATSIARRGRAESAEYLAEGRAAKAKLLARTPAPIVNTDGTRTYTVAMGATTPHAEILAFAPTPKHVRAGDHVTFVNESGAPHTASFGGPLVPLNPQVDEVRTPVPGPSPQPLTSDTYLNTGWLPPKTGGTPMAQRTYTFDAPNPGTYSYECVLHVGSGMAGEIDVGS